ncbi:MAG: PilZ domain-containing protein [Lachnospiraceae bacterium]|jgi:c-di-GMP-binding flagellar brake protein YcgR|nr:PilZ domain-containing protein [Lachnospiraceae bacterium]
MQEERRKYKRLDLDVKIQLQCVSEGDITTEKYLHVNVTNASEGGIAFRTKHELKVGSLYDTKLVIWTKEELQTVIKIIRVTEKDDMYEYGCIFVGMGSSDALKIQIYQMLHDE